MEVDLAMDRFDVRFDPRSAAAEDLLALVRDLGYEPEVVDAAMPRSVKSEPVVGPSLGSGPAADTLRELLAGDAPVLLRFSGPG